MQRIMCLSSILVIRYDDRNRPLEDVLALAILLLFAVAIMQVRK